MVYRFLLGLYGSNRSLDSLVMGAEATTRNVARDVI
jgi:hypothetical protein